MIDTSALIASLVAEHKHHAVARARLDRRMRIPVIVLAEAFSQLRRTFGQSAGEAAEALAPWTDRRRPLPTTAASVTAVLARASELELAGNIHDALIAQVCKDHRVELITLNGRQHRLALALGVESTYLLA